MSGRDPNKRLECIADGRRGTMQDDQSRNLPEYGHRGGIRSEKDRKDGLVQEPS